MASNDGVPFESPKSNESCVMTEFPNEEEYEASRSVGNGQTEANFWYCVELDPTRVKRPTIHVWKLGKRRCINGAEQWRF